MDNAVFKTKERTTASMEINCARWYINQLAGVSKGKAYDDIEIPTTIRITDGRIRVAQEFEDWGRPIMPHRPDPLPPFDMGQIPKVWRKLIADIAESNSVPAEAVYVLKLAQLGSLIGNKLMISPKRYMVEWKEAHNIFAVYVSKSGTRKSQMMKISREPMIRLQKTIDESYNSDIRDHSRVVEMLEPQIKELEKRIKEISLDLLDDDNPLDRENLESTQNQLEKLKNNCEPPMKRQLVVHSATPEKLLEILANNPTGSMVMYNELTELLQKFGKIGYENYRTMIMDAWDGYQSYSHQTKHNGDIHIDKMCLSLYGAIQPSMFYKYIKEIYNGVNDDGFFQRALYVINESDKASEAVDISFNHSQYFKEYEIYHKAYEMEPSADDVKFTKEALELLMKYETEMNDKAVNARSDALGSFISKNIGKLVTLASNIQYLLNNGEELKEVDTDAFHMAKYLMDRQMSHIDSMFPSDSVRGLSEFIDEIRSGIIPKETTMYNLSRIKKKYFGDIDNRNKLMAELTKRNIVKAEKSGQSVVIKTSPYLS
jgi:hypothetical protein